MQQSQVPHLGGLLQRLRAEREDEKHGNDSLAKRIPTTSLPVSRREDSGPRFILPGPASPLKKDYANDYDNSTRGTLTKGLQLNLEADNVQWLNDDVEDSDPDVFGQELLELETLVTDTIRDPFQELFREQDLELQNERSVSSLNNTASSTTRNYRRATKKLSYEKYAVGWICALPVEMAAAKAMLDEIHIPLPNPRGDNNAYQLGSIGRHNIVITCIRSGVYGTTSATAAAITMRSTYPNSSLAPFMVGIGGGVPRPDTNDIRLGDVVISTPTSEYPAVVQYDYGKATQEGVLEHKGSLNKPAPILLSALSHFRSQLAPHSVQVSKHILDAQYRSSLDGGMFSRPDPQTDFLSAKECNSHDSESSCLDCPTGRVDRKARNHGYPEIHYGSIASGNQVIKNAGIRDLIATRFGILCFEMEAAGVMDYLPCLVIRGVSDYCDAQKNKEWQSYAAVAAAAVAKELLSYIPFLELGTSDTDLGEHQKLLDALDFEDSNTRRATVKRPHSRTCRWLLQQQQLLELLDPKNYQQHHGMLWIKGKPGTGKSTIMKYLTDHTETLYNDNKFISVVSYFFNARGPELGRSTIGMYRSLLVQIFEKMPSLQSLVDHKRLRIASVESFVWTTEALEGILRQVVKSLDRMQLICFIDALDECPEDQVRDMVDFLEELSQLAAPSHLHICLSSRHYPHISIKKGCEFVLETQEGHTTDILNYLDAELVLGRNRLASELKKKAYAKSGGIFLWIVLVVQILKREYDRGGIHNLMGILNKIPTQVDDLFRDMLTRDSINLSQLIASIRWVLYAQRPLKVDEFYYAMLSSESIVDVTTHRDDELCYEDMHRYMLSCSKGIVEATTAVHPTVQFIHETVREFLLQPAVLEGLWPGFEGISEGPSHEILKQCCFRYLKQLESKGFRASVTKKAKVLKRNLAHAFPFSRYAVGHILDHADKAQRCKISQTDFLEEFESTHWSYYKDLTSSITPKYSEDFGCALAINKRQDLFKCWLERAKNSLRWPDLESYLMLQLLLDNNISASRKSLQ